MLEIRRDLEKKLLALAQQDNKTVDAVIEDLLDAVPAHEIVEPESHIPPNLKVLALAADALVVVNNQYKIVDFDDSVTPTFGYTADELVGQPLSVLLPRKHRNHHPEQVKKFFTSDDLSRHMAARQRINAMRANGELFPVDISLYRYQQNGDEFVAALVRDMTKYEETTRELQAQQQIFELITENVLDVIVLHDDNGDVSYISPSCKQMLGYEESALLGENLNKYIHPDDTESVIADYAKALKTGTVQKTRFRFLHGQFDDYIWLETVFNTVKDDGAQVPRIVSTSRDISDLVAMTDALKHERDLLSRIMDTSPSGVTVVNPEGEIIYSNKRAEELLGRNKDEMGTLSYNSLTWKHTDYDGNPWLDEQQPFVRVMATKEPVWDVRHAIEWSDGKRVYLSINGAPILDNHGNVSYGVFTVEDYTERKLQQDELEAALTREREINELKSNFISMVSHEFRTPLAVMLTSLGILQRKRKVLSDDDYERRLKKLFNQVHRLEDLMEDVTFLNKYDHNAHKSRIELINVGDFFRQLKDEMETAFPTHKPIVLQMNRITNHTLIEADIGLLQKVFVNLLSNAMKYTDDNGTVICQVRSKDEHLHISIEDDGIGIPEHQLEKIFSSFFRAENVGTISGTGLGLTIAKRAIDTMGGVISFAQSNPTGVTVHITLPAIQPAYSS